MQSSPLGKSVMARERRLLLFFSAAYVLNSLWFKCCDGAAFVPGLGCGQDQPVEVIKDKIEGPEQIVPCSLVYDVKGFQKHYVENLISK